MSSVVRTFMCRGIVPTHLMQRSILQMPRLIPQMIMPKRRFFSPTVKGFTHYSPETTEGKTCIMLWHDNTSGLAECTDTYLKNGWLLVGGPRHVEHNTCGWFFYQMIIKDQKYIAKGSDAS